MATCTQCGAELKPGTKFCENCGAKVSVPQPAAQPAAVPQPSVQPTQAAPQPPQPQASGGNPYAGGAPAAPPSVLRPRGCCPRPVQAAYERPPSYALVLRAASLPRLYMTALAIAAPVIRHTTPSTRPFTPTKAMTNRNALALPRAATKPWIYSVL